jgi:mannose-6-phosphate isomerase-like protein (cupin superfamily)
MANDAPEEPSLARLMVIAESIRAPWRPHPALTVNQATLRVVKFQGHVAQWHTHTLDECYVVLSGEVLVELRGEPAVRLQPGDAYVVRAGVEHRPFALPLATILLIT